ncbi:MAG TPA: CDP-alcohol phosphatidyltransferase family protein [Gemmatimonadales bacterium]|nr:CDP-alcohol phosphatidyltransferase family protein [Gemmatimonadales bacterium]
MNREPVAKLVPAVVERGYIRATTPLVGALVRSGVTPNTLTTVGAMIIAAAAVAFGLGMIRTGGWLVLVSGVVDTLDGQVARHSGKTTPFGAFYDSTLDRVGDGACFIGIAAYLLAAPDIRWRHPAVILCMVGIVAALVVSYMRARAEGLGLECKVGIAQRAERILLLGLPTAFVGAGPEGLVLTTIVVALTILSLITVGQRFAHVHRVTAGAGN